MASTLLPVTIVTSLLVMLGLTVTVNASQGNINAGNCRSEGDLYDRTFSFPPGALKSTVMQYALDTAVNRAIFYSLIYNWTAYDPFSAYRSPWQTRQEYSRQPGLNYIYMSTAANVHSAPAGVESSGLFFDVNSSYPNWLYDVSFNQTLRLFGIRADENIIKEFGSTPDTDYTDSSVIRQNEFFQDLRSSNNNGYRHVFEMRLYGQTGIEADRMISLNSIAEEEVGLFTRPYFDCGQSNLWVLDAVSMVTELMVRNSMWMALRHMKSVAASTVSVTVDALQGLNPTTGIPTTARAVVTPQRYSQGVSKLQEQNTAHCGNRVSPATPVPLSHQFWNVQDLALTLEAQGRAGLRLSHFLSNFLQNNDFADNDRNAQIQSEAYRNWYPGQAEPTFASPMYQVKIDRGLTYKQMVSEVFATLMSADKIMSVGIFVDTDVGVFSGTSDPVSAYAWKGAGGTLGKVVDLYEDGEDFTREDWFIQAKQTFDQISESNTNTFSTLREVRVSRLGAARPTPEPVTYIATSYDQGTWLPPQFVCSWQQAGWTASYVSPILVRGPLGQGQVVFGGVVKVDAVFTADNISP